MKKINFYMKNIKLNKKKKFFFKKKLNFQLENYLSAEGISLTMKPKWTTFFIFYPFFHLFQPNLLICSLNPNSKFLDISFFFKKNFPQKTLFFTLFWENPKIYILIKNLFFVFRLRKK